ncbi:hypothetical protein FVER53590_25492 [Fusarium verticillioides]|nr:hypothetical protein FVER53590_25492 [Fusarium verticillioides]
MEKDNETAHGEHREGDDLKTLAAAASSVKLNSRGIVLFPRPTNDPNDPLNWSALEKYSTYLTVCFFTFLATMNASNFTVAVKPLSAEFHRTPTEAGYLVCFNVLWLGVGNIFWVPLMRVIGKRPVYLVALLLLMGCNIWSFETHSYGSLLAARIISGFAASASDATVPSLVTDLFFIHERGHCMMIFHMALSSGFFLGPLICSWVTQAIDWRWTCGILSIAAGLTFIVGVFTIRESQYPRDKVDFSLPIESYKVKRGFLSQLSLTRGYDSNASFVGTFLRILTLVAYPPVLWTGLTVGAFVGWNLVVQLTASSTFTKPPYNWHIGMVGILGVSGFIGAVFAFFIGGKLIDILAIRMTKRNRGRHEPEYRLPAIIVPAVIGPMGVLIFGLCIAHHTNWVGSAFGYAMEGFGLTAVSNVAVTYAVDCYPELAGEALVVIFIIRNSVGTILALYTTKWQEGTGVQNAFGQMVGLQYFLILIVVPMYMFGKRIRAWTATFGPAKYISFKRPNEIASPQ